MNTSRTDATPLAQARILCADDDDVWRELLANMLRRAGAEIVTVSDGAAALGTLERAEFDVLVSDLNMPHTNGLELVRAARRAHVAPPARLAISGENSWVAAARTAGFHKVLLKPVSRVEVLTAIGELLHQARRRRLGLEWSWSWTPHVPAR